MATEQAAKGFVAQPHLSKQDLSTLVRFLLTNCNESFDIAVTCTHNLTF